MEVSQLLEQIMEKLDNIEIRLARVEASTRNMDTHISFVEALYQKIQSPFLALMGWSETLLLSSSRKEITD